MFWIDVENQRSGKFDEKMILLFKKETKGRKEQHQIEQ